MKKIIVLGLCVSILLATSCSQTSTSATTEESCSVENTTVQSSQSISTTATTTTEFTYEEYIPEYDVDQTSDVSVSLTTVLTTISFRKNEINGLTRSKWLVL